MARDRKPTKLQRSLVCQVAKGRDGMRKICWRTRRAAGQEARRLKRKTGDKTPSVYTCKFCGFYHVGG